MPEKKKFRDSKGFWVLFWIIIAIIFIGICGAIVNKQKEQAAQEKSQGIVNGKFVVNEEYAASLCAKQSNFPNIDWSQNEMVSKYSMDYLGKDQYRLKEDETKPVYYYRWSMWSNLYGKGRDTNCYFVTDMDTHQSTIIWLYYRDLETGTGNIDAIGSEQDLRAIVK